MQSKHPNEELMNCLSADIGWTKRRLVQIVNAQAHELSAIMGLLNGYNIKRGDSGVTFTPYGRVSTAMSLLHKCRAVTDYDSTLDDPDDYQREVFSALLKQAAATAERKEP